MLQFFLFSLMVYGCLVVFCAFVAVVEEIFFDVDTGYGFGFNDILKTTLKCAVFLLLPLLLANMIRFAVFVFMNFWG